MTVVEKVYDILKNAAAVTALVPAARIKPPGDWQNLARPYIVHMPISVETIYDHTGLKALRIWDYYQVSIFGDDYSTTHAAAVAVRDALSGTTSDGVTAFWRPGSWYVADEMVGDKLIQHIAIDFRISEAL